VPSAPCPVPGAPADDLVVGLAVAAEGLAPLERRLASLASTLRADAAAVLDAARDGRVAIALVDTRLIDAPLLGRMEAGRIAAVAAAPDPDEARRLLAHGLVGYLPADLPRKALAAAIQLMRAGEPFVPASLLLAAEPAGEELRTFLDQVPAALYRSIAYRDGRREMRLMSRGVAEVTGLEMGPGPVDPAIFNDRMPEEDRDRYQAMLAAAPDGAVTETDFRLDPPSGERRWLRNTARRRRLPTGERVAYGVIVDVSRGHRAEEQLRSVAYNLPGFIFRADLDEGGLPRFQVLSFNDELAAWLGITPAEGIADPARMVARIHADDLEPHLRAVREAVAAVRPINREFRICSPSGEVRWLRMLAHIFQGADGRVVGDGIAIDITHEKQVEAELRESEARLRAITLNLPAAVFRHVRHPARGGRLAFASPAIENITGRSVEALTAAPDFVAPLVHEEDRAAFEAGWREALQGGAVEELEFRLVRDGGSRWVRLVARATPGEDGELIVDGVLLDVDHRRRIAEELDRRNRQLAVMSRVSAIALASRDVNQALRRMVAEMGETLPGILVAIALFDEQRQTMNLLASTVPEEIGRRFPADETMSCEVVRTRREVMVADSLARDDSRLTTMRRLGERSMFGTPIRIGENAIGTLCLTSRQPMAFDPPTRELARSYADAIATSIAQLSLAALPEAPPADGAAGIVFGLTPRQRQVLELLVGGHSNREIAKALGLQEPTVKVHLRAIYQALGVNSRLKAASRVRELEALVGGPPPRRGGRRRRR
jgi:PAS domain S-box-containing protein